MLLDEGVDTPSKLRPGTGLYLALCEEVGHQCPLHSILHIAVWEDDERRFAPKFQGNRFDSFSWQLHDLSEQTKIQKFNTG